MIILTTAITRAGAFAAGARCWCLCPFATLPPIDVNCLTLFPAASSPCAVVTTAATADACRLNVALTRARHHLIVVGCAPALQQSAPALAALVAACRSTPGGFSPHGRLGT